MPFLRERSLVFQNLSSHGPEKALRYWVNNSYTELYKFVQHSIDHNLPCVTICLQNTFTRYQFI